MNKNKIISSIVILILIFTTIISFFLYSPDNASQVSSGRDNTVLLCNNSQGSVIKLGPYGNQSSLVKIAYIIGVHPLESKAHQAVFNSIRTNDKHLKYCYYIYKINVTQNPQNYDKGRLNGQILANKFVVPDIITQKFDLVIDVHSNVGNWKENQFIFSPIKGTSSEKIAMKINDKLDWLNYYVPPNPTSTKYVTIPLIKGGIPSIIYETYVKNSFQKINDQANEFVLMVDGLAY